MEFQESWRVRVDDRVYVAELDELIEWVKEGAVAPDDLVQKGSLRWLSARRVPELSVHYYKQTSHVIDDPLALLERNGQLAAEPIQEVETPLSTGNETSNTAEQQTKEFCSRHPAEPTAVVCEICHASFCSRCPHRFGNVKLCPLCGGICTNYQDVLNGAPARGALNKPYARKVIDTADQSIDSGKRLGIRDLLRAVAYSFSGPIDILMSTLFLAGCAVGLVLFIFGTVQTTIVAAVCAILLLVFSFDRLSLINSSVNEGTRSTRSWSRSRSTVEGSFLKRIIRTFAVYASSFGLFAALLSTAGLYAWSRYANDAALTESAMQNARHTIAQELRESFARVSPAKTATVANESGTSALDQTLKQADSADEIPIERIVMSFMRLSVYYLVPIFLLLVAGIIHLPSAFVTAVVTRSARKLLNPLTPLRYIRLLGFDYVLLVFSLLCFIVTFSGISWGIYIALPLFLPFTLAVSLSSLILGAFLAIGWSAFSYLLSVSVRRRVDDLA